MTLSAASINDVAVAYSTTDGTAKAGADYTSASGTLIIAAGKTTGTVTVPILNDTISESTEAFKLTLTSATNATLSSTASSASGTIADDDTTTTLPTLTITGGSCKENAGTMTFNVLLSASSSSPVTVEYTTVAGSATAGSDYTTTVGTLTIAAGKTSGTIVVPILNDTIVEKTETFTVTLSKATNATIATASATGTITDDDTPVTTTPTLSINDVSASENAGSMTFTVTLSAVSDKDVTVQYYTTGVTATSGSDYASANGVMTIAAGDTTGTITVALTNDDAHENDETFTVTLVNPANATIATAVGTGTIVNDDAIDTTPPTMSIAQSSAKENAGTVAFTVTFSKAFSSAVTVQYATSDGTAVAGSDYTAASGTLTIAAGQTTGTITVAIIGDTTYESDEDFTVTLTSPTNATPRHECREGDDY